jgi:hypothetical protein
MITTDFKKRLEMADRIDNQAQIQRDLAQRLLSKES